MDKFCSYVIVSDLDGTFFGENAAVLQNNVEAIDYFKKHGGKFTFATGRDYKILEHQFKDILTLPNCPGILCNGVYLYDFENEKETNSTEIDKDELLCTISLIKKKVPEATFRISFPDGFLCSKDNPLPFPDETKDFLAPITTYDDLDKYKELPWYKLVYCYVKARGGENWINQVLDIAKAQNYQHIDYIPSASHLLEFLPKGTGKECAINFLKNMYPDRKVICVGDYDNDLGMLKSADIAACPENAIDPVKQISTIHLCHHSKGCIADLIYKLDSSSKK